ncbi:uncharacterized protein CBL_06851 [Carabus blaptoides fortunei]
MRSTFLDSLRLLVKAGNGGNGLPKYGGVGGQGGDVFVVATEDESLAGVIKKWPKKRISAGHGHNSHHNYILGPPGQPAKIEVPLGITVLRDDGRVIGEINEPGTEILVARGGVGGAQNTGYLGMKGQSHMITLDLKLIADIGLVGFPNAGKSTLLKAISNAKPKIASYPFTTIRPNVGTVEYKDFRQITVADLPGLIEGAHVNIGMGHKFLKHVERTKLLLLVVDINGFQLSPRHSPRTCLENVLLLNKELELYNSDLLDKPAMLVINKMDTSGADRIYEEIQDRIKHMPELLSEYPDDMRPERALVFDEVLPISAKLGGQSIGYLKERVRTVQDVHAANQDQDQHNAELQKRTAAILAERGPTLV